MEVRTLCYRCKTAYEIAGYKVIKIKYQKVKSECELCKRTGFDYRIEIKKKEPVKDNRRVK